MTEKTVLAKPEKADFPKLGHDCTLCMRSHKGTCAFSYCHVAYSIAMERYNASIGIFPQPGHYNITAMQEKKYCKKQ